MATRTSDEIPESVLELVIASTSANWETEKDIYVFGGLPVAETLRIAEGGSMSWLSFRVFLAKAAFGDLQAMREIYGTIDASDQNTALKTAYEVILNPRYRDPRRNLNMEVIHQIGKWGVPVSPEFITKNSMLLLGLAADDRARILAGMETGKVLEAMDSAARAGDDGRFGVFQVEMKKRDGAVKMDDSRLVTTDYEPSAEGLGKLKKIFDFHAARVLEIYKPPGTEQQLMASVSFEEYDRNVIEEARENLVALKGDPDSARPFVRKMPLGAGALKHGG